MNKMKRFGVILVFIVSIAATSFADIKPPVKSAPTATPVDATQVGVSISVSKWEKDGTLVITKSGLEKLNAAARAQWGGTGIAEAEISPRFSTQTLVGGLFLSLAFVFGGVWLARSKGQVSKPALGVMVLAIVGVGATLVTGNVAPPKRIALDSGIIDADKMRNSVAAGKMKLLLVDRESNEDVMLVLGNKEAGSGNEE
jgi:hypothetical protein